VTAPDDPSASSRRVTVFVAERHHYHGRSAYMAIFEFLFYHRVAGATVTRGLTGFGADRRLHTADIEAASENLPIQIEFVATGAQAEELLPKLREMVGEGMVVVQPAEVYFAPGGEAAGPRAHPGLQGACKLMRIYVSEKQRWRGKPLHEALVESLRAHDLAGATVYRGLAGYGHGGRLHRDHPLAHDLPIMITVVDTEAKIRAYLPLLDEMIGHGLVALSDVEVIKYTAPGGKP